MIGEIAATQDAMNALAGDTGGRALRNMNYFDRWVDEGAGRNVQLLPARLAPGN